MSKSIGYLVFPSLMGIGLSVMFLVVGGFAYKLFVPTPIGSHPSEVPVSAYAIWALFGPLPALAAGIFQIGGGTARDKKSEAITENNRATGWAMVLTVCAYVAYLIINGKIR
jgi:hypothetical protein